MSNLFLNIRLGPYHLQWAHGKRLPRVGYNPYWKWSSKPLFSVYQFFD